MVTLRLFGKRIREFREWESTFLNTVGLALLGIGCVMLLPLVTALYYGEDITPFAIPMAFSIFFSLPLLLLFRPGKNMRPVDGLLLMFAIWGIAMMVGAIPFIYCGMGPVDAVFESISGFTTTGATIITETGDLSFDTLSNSILLWRSLTQWIGGIAIILVFMSIFPILGVGGRTMFRNEMSGSGSKGFTARMRDAAKEFTAIYAILSFIFLAACILMGVDPFESLCLTFTTISTGGFLPYHGDITYSVYVQMLIILFMFLGGTNFYLHYQRLYRKKDAGYMKNSEFRSMFVFYAIAAIAVFAFTYGLVTNEDILEHAKNVVFTVVSMGTSTGLTVHDDVLWAVPAAVGFLFIVALIGGSSGSTAGGIKVGRIVTMLKSLTLDMKKRIYPRAVFGVKMGGETLDEDTVSASSVLIFLFIITILLGSLALMILEPITIEESMILSLTSTANCGFIPSGDFASLSSGSKGVLSLLMWVGRLEIGTAILLFTPFFWKEIIRGQRKMRRIEKKEGSM